VSETVELHPAWCFTCPECGRDTFVRAHSPCSLEGVLPDDFDPERYEGGEWISKPTQVTCEHCGLMSAVEEDE